MSAPRRLGLWLPWGAFAALMAVWSGWWLYVRAEGLERLKVLSSAGFLSTSAITADGFPLRLTYRLKDAALRRADGLTFEAASISLNVNLSSPRQLLLDTRAPLGIVLADGRRLDVSGRQLRLSIRSFGTLDARTIFQAEGLQIRSEALGPATIDRLVVGVRPDPRGPQASQVSLAASGIAFATAPYGLTMLGTDIATVRLAAVLPAGSGRAFGGFVSGKTAAQIEALDLAWGPLQANGTGTARLDPATGPAISLSLAVKDAPQAMGLLAQSPGLSGKAQRALSAWAAAPPTQIPAAISDGVLRLGEAAFPPQPAGAK